MKNVWILTHIALIVFITLVLGHSYATQGHFEPWDIVGMLLVLVNAVLILDCVKDKN